MRLTVLGTEFQALYLDWDPGKEGCVWSGAKEVIRVLRLEVGVMREAGRC